MIKPLRICFIAVILSLLIVSTVTPTRLLLKENVEELQNIRYQYDKMKYSINFERKDFEKRNLNFNKIKSSDVYTDITKYPKPIRSDNGLMDSAWPMKCHDPRHTAQSPYSTEDNPHTEKWRFISKDDDGTIESSPVVDSDGIIYFGTMGSDHKLYALYPNGTKKWSYEVDSLIWSTPAIGEDGTVYCGSWDAGLYAINPNGTLKWRFPAGASISNSPTIAEDGTIYFGTLTGGSGYRIYAVNPNGTEKWSYLTGSRVCSDPAIGEDGTIYIGSCDHFLYALYPNGTLRWRFETGGEIRGHPSIDEDDTIYIPSLDAYLYAIYLNGTMKWKVHTGYGSASSAAIAEDGTLYIGTDRLHAVYPKNGTVKWTLDIGGDILSASPAISSDGTIYVSTGTGKSFVAVNSIGDEIWRKQICNLRADSSPIIGEDGTIYVGSSGNDENNDWYGCLHAFGSGEPKKIQIEYPEPGKLYLFGHEIISTPFNNTVIIGNINVEVHAYLEEEIETIDFYIDGSLQFTDTEPPFEWTINQRFGRWPLMRHEIKVEALYNGGCSWADGINVWYFHL